MVDLSTPLMGAFQHLLSVKLTPTNYILWQNQMEPLINCFDLKQLIDPATVAPAATFTASDGKVQGSTPHS